MTIHVRIATYNVHKCRGLDRKTSPARIADVIAELKADVIALQEVLDVRGRRSEFDQARQITSRLRDYALCFGENRPLYGGAYGNMTLSRWPIQRCQNYDISWRHRERRGCLRSDIVLAGGAVLHVFNVHLGTSFLERRAQARSLLSDELLHSDEHSGPRVVVGDFNEWTRGLASRLMGRTFKTISPRSFSRYGRTYPGITPVLHLDHFYYDPILSLRNFHLYRNRRTLIASDHLPMVADFVMESDESSGAVA